MVMHLKLGCPVKKKEETEEEKKLDSLLQEIGVARFAGRINSGLIDQPAGFRAIGRFIDSEEERPFLSKLGQALMGRSDSYEGNS